MNIYFRSLVALARRMTAALALGFVALATVMSCPATAQSLVDIATAPLYAGRQPHPNVVVSTSVEFPTVGAAYLNLPYLPANKYAGYFDASKCYSYVQGNGGYFKPSTDADPIRHECVGGFSGNFMNWATMSAIDEFRYAMTGGNRVDEHGPAQGTIIQRAFLPDGSIRGVPSFYNFDSNFPRHTLLLGTIDGVPSSFAHAVLPGLPLVGDLLPVVVTNCRSQVFFGPTGLGDCNHPDNLYGTYNVRVNVCDNQEGPVRTDLCLQYGGRNGRYKPVGQTQINAAQMRFAVFGYLMDHNVGGYTVPSGCEGDGWNQCRYGGVLRSPMKYVGPTTYDASQTAAVNNRAEINADGTQNDDPEGNASTAGGSHSGFINYINKFGTVTDDPDNGAGAGVNGVYKRYDPGAEMFYEAIRYYQNLGPTDLAAQNIPNNAVKGNYPLTTNWTDPIGSTCSANYIINLSDANTWYDDYLPGANGASPQGLGRPSSRPAEGGLDAYLWTSRIGTLESTTSSLVADDVRPGLAGLQNRGTGAGNSGSYLGAGAAYWANVNDIRPDLVGKQTIKTISFDVAEGSIDQHDRQLYLMGKYGGFNNVVDRSSDTFPNLFYGANPANPTGPAIRTNSEWEQSPGSGYPANYLLASDPQKLIDGLRAAFASISTPNGNLSGAAVTSANLTYGPAGAYIATFDPAAWSGSVKFYSLSVDPTTQNLVVSGSSIWDSGSLLTARCGTVVDAFTVCNDTDTSVNRRNILTTVSTGRTTTTTGVRTAVPFTYDAISSRDTVYTTALATNPVTNTVEIPDPLAVPQHFPAQDRINYLRGFRLGEVNGLGYRSRDSVMGDVINSGAVFSGPPTPAIPDTDYQAFYTSHLNRTPAVYVGANDGMLHALNANTGVELFSYIPGYSYADLNQLTNPGYVHKVFVDTVPKVQEAKVGSGWKTVLLGANGNGVQGIFALDVSDPGSFSPPNVMFEFSDADDPDLGSVVSTPEFAKMWVSGTGANKVYRYFAVVTAYNNKRTTVNARADSNVSTDSLNKGVLFLIALDHTLGAPWVLNTDYYKFVFPASNPANANGLGPVTLLASKSGDRSTAAMYFGDLQGNLWKFNTATGSPSTWASVLGTPSSPLPIFVAQDNSGTRQPITARPELANGPFGSTLVFFGTGRYLGTSDLTLPGTVQSEYSLLDINPSVLITRSSDLVPRTATVSGGTVAVSGAAFSYSGTASKKGWYLDFPSSTSLGERSVTKPAISSGLLTFTTLTLSNDLCTAGNGYIYQVNALSGLAISEAGTTIGYSSTVGIPGPPRVVDLTLTSGADQATGEVINKKTQTTLVSGTSGNIAGYGNRAAIKVAPTQRINWRELTNWNDRTGH